MLIFIFMYLKRVILYFFWRKLKKYINGFLINLKVRNCNEIIDIDCIGQSFIKI